MAKYSEYIIPLKNLEEGVHKFEYKLTNDFFAKIDDPDIRKGKLNAVVDVKKSKEMFELKFDINGAVQIACDRCLDDMEQPIAAHDKLFVKFGKDFAEENNNVVVVPFEEGEINVAWFIFEFISLSVPLKHVHPLGKCNKEMTARLKQVSAYEKDDEEAFLGDEADFEDDENTTSDPRWNELKKLIDDNN